MAKSLVKMPESDLPAVIENFPIENTPPRRRGRPSTRDRNIEVLAQGEHQILDRYEEMVEAALELALGRKPEKCPFHHMVLRCPHTHTEIRVASVDGLALLEDLEEQTIEVPCKHESQARAGDAGMLRYMMDRVAGRAPVAGERQVKLEFVRRVANHIAVLFQEVNVIEDHEERAHAFAAGMTRMWMVMSESE